MKLSQLMIGVDAAYADGEMEIEGITCDSRRVKPGWAFVCIQGTAADGHAFAQKAVEAGASLVVAQRDLGLACQLMVPSTRRAWARMSANWFGNPAEKLHLVGKMCIRDSGCPGPHPAAPSFAGIRPVGEGGPGGGRGQPRRDLEPRRL